MLDQLKTLKKHEISKKKQEQKNTKQKTERIPLKVPQGSVDTRNLPLVGNPWNRKSHSKKKRGGGRNRGDLIRFE